VQKDFHFYVTYALARRLGIPRPEAELIAWANQFTDELDEGSIHRIQTQSALLGNWDDPQIQMSVLVPFHFVPGNDPVHPWKTTPDSPHARDLLALALASRSPLRLGIALHAIQDTFSHQGFSGWREELNSCYPWYSLTSALPNVGHAEMRATPDIVNIVWTDPRSNERIDNRYRAMEAARVTCRMLQRWSRGAKPETPWQELKKELKPVFATPSYDERKEKLRKLAGDSGVRYSNVARRLQKPQLDHFITAAAAHLAAAIERFPWPGVPPAETPGAPRTGVSDTDTPAAAPTAATGPAGTPPTPSAPLDVRLSPSPFQASLRISVTGTPRTPEITITDRLGRTVARLSGRTTVWTPEPDITPGLYRVRVGLGDTSIERVAFYSR